MGALRELARRPCALRSLEAPRSSVTLSIGSATSSDKPRRPARRDAYCTGRGAHLGEGSRTTPTSRRKSFRAVDSRLLHEYYSDVGSTRLHAPGRTRHLVCVQTGRGTRLDPARVCTAARPRPPKKGERPQRTQDESNFSAGKLVWSGSSVCTRWRSSQPLRTKKGAASGVHDFGGR